MANEKQNENNVNASFKNKSKKISQDKSEIDKSNTAAESKKKSVINVKKDGNKNAAIAALTLVTEQTLKDINKWLDDTPKYSEFSSSSNSPAYSLDDFDFIKKEDETAKQVGKATSKSDNLKDIKKRSLNKDHSKLCRRREVQRTIDRLQPGKSKGNLLSSNQSTNKVEDILPVVSSTKTKEIKNSLIIKSDDSAPKLSLGSVLDSFGKHKFIDDTKKEESKPTELVSESECNTLEVKNQSPETKQEVIQSCEEPNLEKATPNLSAWFKAFGAPKVTSNQKKSDVKSDNKEVEDTNKKVSVIAQDHSPNPESPVIVHGQPTTRQRKISTGSSMSERSSFSQDMDSPRVGIDERIGAYPAPYPSPLHKSPSGVSPILTSPKQDASPKATTYPNFNGQMRVGFYQDTVSLKSSPDKSCSPRDPQSPHTLHSEYVYTSTSTHDANYTFSNNSYYNQNQNFNAHSSTPTYDSNFYETTKSLTDHFQAKGTPNYSNSSYDNSNSHSMVTTFDSSNNDITDNQLKVNDKLESVPPVFPVKKRAYNEAETNAQMHNQKNTQQHMHFNNPLEANIIETSNYSNPSASNPEISNNNLNPGLEPVLNNKNFNTGNAYQLNNPSTRADNGKEEMSPYINYSRADMNYRKNVSFNNAENNYLKSSHSTIQQNVHMNANNSHPNDILTRYSEPSVDFRTPSQIINSSQQPHLINPDLHQVNLEETSSRLQQTEIAGSYKPNLSRNPYNPINMEESLNSRRNLINLSHVADKYHTDERLLSSLQTNVGYYPEKSFPSSHMFTKPGVTTPSDLPIFSQPNISFSYNNISSVSTDFNKQINDLQNASLINTEKPLKAQQILTEKKLKRKKHVKAGKRKYFSYKKTLVLILFSKK